MHVSSNNRLNKFHEVGKHHVEPVLMIVLSAYVAFIGGELMTLSGIVSTVVFSFGVRHYAVYNLTPETRNIVYHSYVATCFQCEKMLTMLYLYSAHQVSELTESAV
jgi:NhaP-type Na+/H+ or K+/H+ antiporter